MHDRASTVYGGGRQNEASMDKPGTVRAAVVLILIYTRYILIVP